MSPVKDQATLFASLHFYADPLLATSWYRVSVSEQSPVSAALDTSCGISCNGGPGRVPDTK